MELHASLGKREKGRLAQSVQERIILPYKLSEIMAVMRLGSTALPHLDICLLLFTIVLGFEELLRG